MNSFQSVTMLFALCILALTHGFAPVARRSLPVMVRNFKQVQSSSQGSRSNNFLLFADNDGKKITRDKEGEFFESEVSFLNFHFMIADEVYDNELTSYFCSFYLLV